jgi:hypothetical protein
MNEQKYKKFNDLRMTDIAVDCCNNKWTVMFTYPDLNSVIDDYGMIDNVQNIIDSPRFEEFDKFVVVFEPWLKQIYACFPYSEMFDEDCVSVPIDIN